MTSGLPVSQCHLQQRLYISEMGSKRRKGEVRGPGVHLATGRRDLP